MPRSNLSEAWYDLELALEEVFAQHFYPVAHFFKRQLRRARKILAGLRRKVVNFRNPWRLH